MFPSTQNECEVIKALSFNDFGETYIYTERYMQIIHTKLAFQRQQFFQDSVWFEENLVPKHTLETSFLSRNKNFGSKSNVNEDEKQTRSIHRLKKKL